MHLMKVDPRALKDNPDRTRQTKSTPQADALLLATIKAVGIVQPPIVFPETGGGNGYIVNAGHRRIRQAIAAGLDEIDVLVDAAANDNGAIVGESHLSGATDVTVARSATWLVSLRVCDRTQTGSMPMLGAPNFSASDR
jgi:hypothetical protein